MDSNQEIQRMRRHGIQIFERSGRDAKTGLFQQTDPIQPGIHPTAADLRGTGQNHLGEIPRHPRPHFSHPETLPLLLHEFTAQ